MLDIEKSVRDPIHGFIGLTHKELEIINTPVFQRLRRIKQLGNTHLVYPGASHSRFEHSLGVLYIANRMAQSLSLGDEETKLIRYAALLHDIGHGPMSHVFENILSIANGRRVSHEEITQKIIEEDEDLDTVLGDQKGAVIDILNGKGKPTSIYREIISSNLDADRLDYLLRDSYYTGVEYGRYDLERILHTIRIQEEGEESYIVIAEKGKDAVEGIRVARYLMHAQVYSHHIRNISDGMFKRALELSLSEGVIDSDYLRIDNEDFLANFLWLDDNRVFDKILQYEYDGPEPRAIKLIRDLENRRLFKIRFKSLNGFGYSAKLKIESLEKDPVKKKRFETRLADACGCDAYDVIAGLKVVETTAAEQGKTPILVKLEDGDVIELEKISPITFGPAIRTFYVVCPDCVEECFKHMKEEQISRLLQDS